MGGGARGGGVGRWLPGGCPALAGSAGSTPGDWAWYPTASRGPSTLAGRGAEDLPEELRRREQRLVRIRQAKAELEAEARASRAAELRDGTALVSSDRPAGSEEPWLSQGLVSHPIMPTPFESALLNLKLFELRREPVLREARDWFLKDFNFSAAPQLPRHPHLSTPWQKYGHVPRVPRRRPSKARDRGIPEGLSQGAQRRWGGCSGARMRAYFCHGVLRAGARITAAFGRNAINPRGVALPAAWSPPCLSRAPCENCALTPPVQAVIPAPALTPGQARRNAPPPLPPLGAERNPLPEGCRCELCATLEDFLSDPGETRLEWPLAKDKRMHVHRNWLAR
jgi:hypothetical protein